MEKEKPISMIKNFKKLCVFIRPYTIWVIVCIFASLFHAAIELSIAKLIENITQSIDVGNFGAMIPSVVIMFGAVIIGVIIRFIISYSSGYFSVNSIRDIRSKMVKTLSESKASFVDTQHSGDIISRLTNDTMMLHGFYQSYISQFFYLPFIFVGSLIYMLMISWELVLINLAVVLLAAFVSTLITRPIGKYTEALQADLGKVNSIAKDSIGGINILKSFNLKEALYNRYKMSLDSALERSLKIEGRVSFIAPVFLLMDILPFLLCILCGGYLAVNGRITTSQLITFIFLLDLFVQPTSAIPKMISGLTVILGAAKRVFEILERPVERKDGSVVKPKIDSLSIEFSEVSFSYDGQVKVLDNLSFEVPKGKMIALVGPSGSGKSSIIKLICGLYDIQRGQIKLFGEDLSNWNLENARSYISLVSQNTYLFPASIAENISYGKQGASMEEIVESAKIANIHDYIESLPKGYDSMVGEQGVRLSGGQKQRISIARAVLRDTPILLLDEPTSALDTQSESVVQETLRQYIKGRTVLVVVHRLSTIKEADEVMVLSEGRIVERGRHEDLMSQNGFYSQLYLKQFAKQNDF